LIALTLTKLKQLLKTEPPLTEEVLQCAINDIFGSQWADTYFEEDGLFIVPRTGIPKEQIPEYRNFSHGSLGFRPTATRAKCWILPDLSPIRVPERSQLIIRMHNAMLRVPMRNSKGIVELVYMSGVFENAGEV
jgi:hypothetical protein